MGRVSGILGWSPVDWSADEWSAFGSVVLAVGAVCTALWAVFNYRKAKRAEAARWLQGMFEHFYLSDQFRNVRALLEYDYAEKVGALLERRLTNRDVPRTDEEQEILQEIDTLLNYFEQVLYLEDNGHLSEEDREALFDYWFDVMRSRERGSLRRYCACFGWERLATRLNAQRFEYVAVYGSLMKGLQLDDAPNLAPYLERVGACTIQGDLYDLGNYPGLVAGEGRVAGELYKLKFDLPKRDATEAFRRLDKYERYDAHDVPRSLYRRCVMRLAEPDVDAWVYVYNHPVVDRPLVASGNWRTYRNDD
jgi:gamma-glutamylcyclotransferase (GGCT)/AIG2-like uncharacterized protein YtfP